MKKKTTAAKRAFEPQIEAAEARLLLSATVIDTEPNDTAALAQVVPANQSEVEIKGRVNTAGDVDVYSFASPAASTTTLKYVQKGGQASTLTVTDSAGTVVGTLGAGTVVRQITLPAGQQLYFSVSGTNLARYEAELKSRSTTPNPINVPVPTPGVIVEEVELNNTAATATPVALDPASMPTVSGSVTKYTDKYDWISLTAPGTGLFAIAVRDPNGGIPVEVEIIDAATGVKLAETKPEYGRNVIGVNVVAGQNLYLKIEGETTATQSYLIDTGFTAALTLASTAPATGSSSSEGTHKSGENHDSKGRIDDHSGRVRAKAGSAAKSLARRFRRNPIR